MKPTQEQIREQIIACGGILPYLELIQQVAGEFDLTISFEVNYTQVVYAALRGSSIHSYSNSELFELIDNYATQTGISLGAEKLRQAVRLMRCGAA